MAAAVPDLKRIALFAAQLQSYDGHPPKVFGAQDYAYIEGALQAIGLIDPMTPQIERSLFLKDYLAIITGECLKVKREYKFPDPFPAKAQALIEKFNEDWGAGEEEEVPPSPSIDLSSGPSDAVRRAAQAAGPAPRRPKPPPQIPRPDHPIFGENGIVHGILVNSSGMKSYCLDGRFPRKKCSVAGHNGLTVGDWWPLQICALRDGAHGSMMSGIAGSKTNGAFSIVVSGMYEHLDADRGDSLYYSGSQAIENTDPDVPLISKNTEAMRYSYQMRRSIRVLRSAKSSTQYSPSKGLRYDGLYLITGEETATNTHGGAYIRFHLQRNGNQEAMDLSRPTAREKRLCDRVKEGY